MCAPGLLSVCLNRVWHQCTNVIGYRSRSPLPQRGGWHPKTTGGRQQMPSEVRTKPEKAQKKRKAKGRKKIKHQPASRAVAAKKKNEGAKGDMPGNGENGGKNNKCAFGLEAATHTDRLTGENTFHTKVLSNSLSLCTVRSPDLSRGSQSVMDQTSRVVT